MFLISTNKKIRDDFDLILRKREEQDLELELMETKYNEVA